MFAEAPIEFVDAPKIFVQVHAKLHENAKYNFLLSVTEYTCVLHGLSCLVQNCLLFHRRYFANF